MLFRRCAKATLQAAVVAGLVLTAAGGLVRPAVAETATAADHIASLSRNAITVLGDSQLTEAQKADELHALFVDGFDIKTLSRTVLGRHWRRADDSRPCQPETAAALTAATASLIATSSRAGPISPASIRRGRSRSSRSVIRKARICSTSVTTPQMTMS